jgi:hypothetical protein
MIINRLFALSPERFENEGKNFLLGTHGLSGLNSNKQNITRRALPVKRQKKEIFSRQ